MSKNNDNNCKIKNFSVKWINVPLLSRKKQKKIIMLYCNNILVID